MPKVCSTDVYPQSLPYSIRTVWLTWLWRGIVPFVWMVDESPKHHMSFVKNAKYECDYFWYHVLGPLRMQITINIKTSCKSSFFHACILYSYIQLVKKCTMFDIFCCYHSAISFFTSSSRLTVSDMFYAFWQTLFWKLSDHPLCTLVQHVLQLSALVICWATIPLSYGIVHVLMCLFTNSVCISRHQMNTVHWVRNI